MTVNNGFIASWSELFESIPTTMTHRIFIYMITWNAGDRGYTEAACGQKRKNAEWRLIADADLYWNRVPDNNIV